MNAKRVYRLYVEESLQIRNKRPKRKVAAKLREHRPTALRAERRMGNGLSIGPAV